MLTIGNLQSKAFALKCLSKFISKFFFFKECDPLTCISFFAINTFSIFLRRFSSLLLISCKLGVTSIPPRDEFRIDNKDASLDNFGLIYLDPIVILDEFLAIALPLSISNLFPFDISTNFSNNFLFSYVIDLNCSISL